jgi:hypothetical protein
VTEALKVMLSNNLDLEFNVILWSVIFVVWMPLMWMFHLPDDSKIYQI